jgi:hypothetical protein
MASQSCWGRPEGQGHCDAHRPGLTMKDMAGRQELSTAHAVRELARGALALHHGVLTLWVASCVLSWCGLVWAGSSPGPP